MKRINYQKLLCIFILILLNVISTNSTNTRKVEAKTETETERVAKKADSEAKLEKNLEKKLEKIEGKKEEKKEEKKAEKKDKIKKLERANEEDDSEDEEREEMGFNPFGNMGKIFSSFGGFGKNSKNDDGFSTKSESFSYSFANNGKGKKPERHMRHMSSEEYREKEKGKPVKIRKYEEMGKKDNDDPAKIKRKASTNVETEELLLGDGKEEKTLKDDEFKGMGNFGFGFDDDFDGFFGSGRRRKGRKHQVGLFGGFFGGDPFGDDPFFGGRRRTKKVKVEKENEKKDSKKSEADQKEEKAIENINGNKFGRYSKFLNEKTRNQLKRR